MDFIIQLVTQPSVAQVVLGLSMVIALGLAIGSVKIFNINFGVAGVLFVGLIFGHFGFSINHEVLEFIRELGLILFVYTIGMQVGPGFISSLKRNGLPLNLMAAFVVIFGAVLTVLINQYAHVPLPAAVGMFSGATTNTPSLAAAQQALKEVPGITEELIKMPTLGYAVAYPFGILGIILTIILTRIIFRINPAKEAEAFAHIQAKDAPPLEVRSLRVDNANLEGITISKIPTLTESGVIISRIQHQNDVQVALPKTIVHCGDILQAVGAREKLDVLQAIIGIQSDVDLREIESDVTARRVIVTRPKVVGKTIAELDSSHRYGVTITRVSRSDIEFAAVPNLSLNFADTLVVVGEDQVIQKFADEMGDSPKHLNHPHLIPIFVGIAFGVLLGSWPIHLPGVPAPVKLGLAGGPLVVAIILSRIGRIGHLIWYMPISVNFMMREFGIALFLACVGLRSGDQFVKTLVQGDGFYWMAMASLITIIPIMMAALFARIKLRLNYLTICGLVAGSMTDPPALAFANSISPSSAPSVAYATVYPLVMILRILSAQIMVMLFFSL
ncbi:MAG: putative transporter [Candidatus Omnitrophica bacterium]|nr:putative transporter [Candidatus Omnitrophota bacterium]